jgi:serine/threonine-protein kinase
MKQQLGPYILLEAIGQDRLGVSHRAFDTNAERLVRLRLLRWPPGVPGRESSLLSLRQWLCACGGGGGHGNVAEVHEVGELSVAAESGAESRTTYVASEWVKGQSLAARLEAGAAVDPAAAHTWTTQILLGLDHAHKLGIVHADLNPANVLLAASDVVRLLDVGLYAAERFAWADDAASAGWPMYLAPEQLTGAAATVRGDIRAAGVLLYRMLAGRPPFVGEPAGVMHQVMTEELPPLSHLRPELGTRFDAVIAQAAALRPERRFGSAGEFVHALNAAVFEGAHGAAADSFPWLESLTAIFAEAVGPMAQILVQRAAAQATDADALCRGLAAHIADRAASRSFLEAAARLARLQGAASVAEPSAAPAAAPWPLRGPTLDRLTAQLAGDLGPMASLLVERAATHSASRREFFRRLLDSIPEPDRQRRLLREFETEP